MKHIPGNVTHIPGSVIGLWYHAVDYCSYKRIQMRTVAAKPPDVYPYACFCLRAMCAIAVTGVLFISGMVPNFLATVFSETLKIERVVYTREFQDDYYRYLAPWPVCYFL